MFNAEPCEAASVTTEGGAVEALYFPSTGRWLFGWLHRPSAVGSSDFGVVICNPFGNEAVCAHRSIRAFAESIAAGGVPVLRFDYASAGDSSDIEAESDLIGAWLDDVVAAVTELQRCTGIARVCLLGFRLGALLAALAAERMEGVRALVAIAPTVSGRRYVAELRTTQLAGSAGGGDSSVGNDGGLEVSGFRMSAATVKALMSLVLPSEPAASVGDVLVIDRSDLPAARKWSEALSTRGIRTEYLCLPGFVEMMMITPHFTVVPRAMIAATCDFLRALQTRSPGVGRSATCLMDSVVEVPLRRHLELQYDGGVQARRLVERPVFLASEPALFGVVTEPRIEAVPRGGVILLNSGTAYRIGLSRMSVGYARLWAGLGYVVLRMDMAGVGDSRTRPGRMENEVFPVEILDDISAAVGLLRNRYALTDITLAGLCSGAYHCLRAAVAGLPVSRLLMVNPENFFWKQGARLTDLQIAEVVRNPGLYRKRMWSPRYWKRILAGEVSLWRIARVFGQRVYLSLEYRVRDFARTVRIRLPKDLGWELRELAARGVRMVFVFSSGDVGVQLLKLQAGSTIESLGPQFAMHIIDGADHIFSRGASRAALQEVLSGELLKTR